MLEFIVLVLSIAFFFYTLLGGADFGAGIIELLTGNKSIRPIYKAIAPVWEVNHMWLILAVVIIFNGFPPIFAQMSISLHIPLFIVLMGIVLRGTAFTFRHYDTHVDGTHVYYHWIFRISSLITAIFLGVTLGAMMYGQIDNNPNGTFYSQFIAPWFNYFCVGVGIFVALIFAYIASIFILGEAIEPKQIHFYSIVAKRFSIGMILTGSVVLLLAYIYQVPFFALALSSPISWIAFVGATLLLPWIWMDINKKYFQRIRILVAVQVGLIMSGWAAAQIPILIHMKDGNHLTVYNSVAPETTLYYLTMALLIGSLLIFPSIYYLFRIFKFKP
ncbi:MULTISPECIES: cytochrome d ubiquinol oxidase subunit II [unclassified Aureispira]|uniref:cytochrome d ubiquinol oxidase subunit II n=1 Tax=unclassified Aureispira TaxID=2649989 RepID=UPI000697CFCC|nr:MULTISPECIES: cytochrome d ubiquinol oxidase subunit II [unclassified Aureispira]WMX14860.1 cytochrome d ubiquinol oxidase subunit II [Aureispira sp. CCB-E]